MKAIEVLQDSQRIYFIFPLMQECELFDIIVGNQNIIHNDIKPENVQIDPDGALKITDFGAAVRTQQEEHLDARNAQEMLRNT